MSYAAFNFTVYLRELNQMMPHAANSPTQTEFYAAIREGLLLGGAALTVSKGRSPQENEASFQMALKESAPMITGETLVQAMKAVSRRADASTLKYHVAVSAGSDLDELLNRCHFIAQGDPVLRYQLRVDSDAWDRFLQTYTKLRARKKLPEQASILPLNRIAAVPMGELLNRIMADSQGAMEAGQVENLNPDTCSVGIQVGPALRGVHVVSASGNEAFSSALIVEKISRGSWMYTALICEVLERLRARKVQLWSFKINPGVHREMKNAAAIMKASLLNEEIHYAFPFT